MKSWVISLGLLLPPLAWGQMPVGETPATGTDVRLVNADSIAGFMLMSAMRKWIESPRDCWPMVA